MFYQTQPNYSTDALSRRGHAPEDDQENPHDVDQYFESLLYNTWATSKLASGPIDHIGRIWPREGARTLSSVDIWRPYNVLMRSHTLNFGNLGRRLDPSLFA